jgi:membrane fusion protein
MSSNVPPNRTAPPDDAANMLPSQPPPKVVRWMAWLALGFFAVAAVASVLVKVRETVHCQFVLESQLGEDPIQSPLLSVVQKVCVAEGREVAEGEDLFVLRSDEVRAWQTQFHSAEEDARALVQRTAKLDELHASQLEIKNEEFKQVEKEIAFREKHLEISRDFLGRHEQLRKDGLISPVELLKQQLATAESEKDLNVAQRALQQVDLQRKQLQTDRARERGEEGTQAEKLKLTIAALTRQLIGAEGDLLHVRAPYRGVVTSLAYRNAGGIVQKGQELCQFSRAGGLLTARLIVEEKSVPRLANGQQVRFQFEAFPSQRFGSMDGQLDWVSASAVTAFGGGQFSARARLARQSFVGGDSHVLRAGMKGKARIAVGRRRIIEYAIDPLRQLRDQLKP